MALTHCCNDGLLMALTHCCNDGLIAVMMVSLQVHRALRRNGEDGSGGIDGYVNGGDGYGHGVAGYGEGGYDGGDGPPLVEIINTTFEECVAASLEVTPSPRTASWRGSGLSGGTPKMMMLPLAAARTACCKQAVKAGPFVTSLNDAGGRAQLGAILGNSRWVNTATCGSAAARKNNPLCSDAYGAVMTAVEEVR